MDQTKSALAMGLRLMAPTCPHCRSTHVETLGYGRRIGGTVGTVAGAASGAAGAMGGAEMGVVVGLLAGPLGAILGGIAGALMGGLAGAAVGGVAGSQLGGVVDENILDNYRCYSCGHSFGEQDIEAPVRFMSGDVGGLAAIESPNMNERAMAKVMALFEGHGKGADLASSKGTAFGLLNSVTEFVDHARQAQSAEHRLESAWFGQGAALKEKALEQALVMIA